MLSPSNWVTVNNISHLEFLNNLTGIQSNNPNRVAAIKRTRADLFTYLSPGNLLYFLCMSACATTSFTISLKRPNVPCYAPHILNSLAKRFFLNEVVITPASVNVKYHVHRKRKRNPIPYLRLCHSNFLHMSCAAFFACLR